MSSSVPDSAAASDPAAGAQAVTTAQWPLRFQRHRFGGFCFDTWGCSIVYNGFPHGQEDPERASASAASFGDAYPRRMKAAQLDIANFPAPAEVTWRAKDKSEHRVRIDIAALFADGLIRHEVAREDVAEGVSLNDPEIILEVNDRTINVYMRCMIPLKRPQDPANPNSDFRADLVRVYSKTY
ncbi:hypothetical protein J5226_16060 [Lysobacter sp. K5869]|uniref:hypothetical protein n=1 Tax=Lysobacter sp. K5869 TaxID=2820808 RepID=UPI001C064614|nr:hypothetical protein [Lysobacter sp. K5869]QWP75139.1 hypothetical protein J5226_16060 [Lysobacter sp. K5869]